MTSDGEAITGDQGGDPACWTHLLGDERAIIASLAPRLGETGDGVHWTLEPDSDLNANLVRLDPWHEIGRHENHDVDVLLVVLHGSGHVRIDDVRAPLSHAVVVHVPMGSGRSVHAGPDGIWYLTVHRRRGPMTIGPRCDREG